MNSFGRVIGTYRSRGWKLLALLILCALLAAACAAEEGGEAAESAATEVVESTEAAEPTEAEPTAEPTEESGASESVLTPVRLVFVPATTGLAVNVAASQGFFEENGLDVELMPAANITEIIPTLGQQVDISLGTATDLIRAADSGLDVVQISGNTIDTEDNPFVRVMVGPDSGIESFADLGGARVSSPTLSGVIHIATLFSAQEAGVDPATIEGVQVPPPNTVDQFNSGQIDAAEALEPFAGALTGMGNVSIGDPFAAIGLPLATNFWIAQGEWATANPDAVEGFTAALEQAIEFIGSDEEAARSVLMEYTGMPMPVATNVALPTFDTEIRTDDLGIWIDVLRALDQFDGDVQPADLVLGN